MATQKFSEAIEKLQFALQLQPDNNEIPHMLRQAKARHTEQERSSQTETRSRTSAEAKASGPVRQQELGNRQLVRQAIPSFADNEDIPSPTQRHIDAFSQWTSLVKPFLLDNVGWFVGAFLVIAGFVILIVTFWNTIEQNQVLMHSLVFASMFLATGMFFAVAYFMRVRYPKLESSSDVLFVIVALLIPLVFAAAILTALIPSTEVIDTTANLGSWRES